LSAHTPVLPWAGVFKSVSPRSLGRFLGRGASSGPTVSVAAADPGWMAGPFSSELGPVNVYEDRVEIGGRPLPLSERSEVLVLRSGDVVEFTVCGDVGPVELRYPEDKELEVRRLARSVRRAIGEYDDFRIRRTAAVTDALKTERAGDRRDARTQRGSLRLVEPADPAA
jgi:hypothetical protein